MNLRHMSKSKYIMKKEKIILCYAFLVQILTVCPIEGKCQKKELIKWILFKEKQFLHLFYLTVQCQITERCSYIIIISKKNEAIIEHMGILIIIYLKKIEILISNLRITSVYTTHNLPKVLAKSFVVSVLPVPAELTTREEMIRVKWLEIKSCIFNSSLIAVFNRFIFS